MKPAAGAAGPPGLREAGCGVRRCGRRHLLLAASYLAVLLPGLWGCALPPAAPAPERLGAWVVYWDAERGLDELERHGGVLDYASLFAYELDALGRPVPAPGLAPARERFQRLARRHGISPWATVVNDVRLADGSVRLKDADIIHAIVSDPDRRAEHARRLARRVCGDGFRGLHLDYERVDRRRGDAFRAFVERLDAELANRGCELDVVVEPARGPRPAPGTAAMTVMGYNLHGPHSGPGPRSTPAFIDKIAARGLAARRPPASIALALGGFLWRSDDGVESVDWTAAGDIAGEAPAERSLYTRVPYARIAAGELWFEDVESIEVKWRAAHAAGFRGLALWRLGGNDEELFKWLEDLSSGASNGGGE
jgi:hypothetical protein